MIYLLLQVVFASSFTLVIKWAQTRSQADIITIGMINYIVAAIAVAPAFFSSEASTAVSEQVAATLTGGTMGAVYFIAFFFVIYTIRIVGASATTVVSVLSIVFPITVAAWTWDEVPSRSQTIGIGLALAALVLIAYRKKQPNTAINESSNQPPFQAHSINSLHSGSMSELESQEHSKTFANSMIANFIDSIRPNRAWLTPIVLLLFYLMCGYNRLAQDFFKHLSAPDQRPTFVFTAFCIAAIPSIMTLIYRRRAIGRLELVVGIALGLSNMLQTFLVLNCLEFFPGYVVFTVTSAGAIVLTTLIATGFLSEKLSAQAIGGICLAVIALVMLQWKFV